MACYIIIIGWEDHGTRFAGVSPPGHALIFEVAGCQMYLLYLDESGAHSQARHFVLAGVAIYEASVYWADNELNRLQAQYFPGIAESVLFHATPLRAGERDSVPYPFNLLDRDTRFKLLDELYEVVQAVHGTFFAVVVEKSSLTANENPYELALEQMLSRFEHFLRRMYLERNQRDKGLVVIADSSYRERLEGVARQFAAEGTRWHNLNNIVAIPFFTLSKNSRHRLPTSLPIRSMDGMNRVMRPDLTVC